MTNNMCDSFQRDAYLSPQCVVEATEQVKCLHSEMQLNLRHVYYYLLMCGGGEPRELR